MSKFDGILLISDIDGTLTYNEKLSDENADAIRYFQKNGGFFSIATGRQPEYIREFYPRIIPNAPIIAINGTVVYDLETNKTIFCQTIGKEVSAIVDYIHSNYPQIFHIEAKGIKNTFLWQKDDDFSAQRFGFEKEIFSKVLLVAETKECALMLQEDLRNHFPDFSYIQSWGESLEIMPKGAGKGELISHISKALPIQKVIAAGDHENDVSLMKYADTGYAVGGSFLASLGIADKISCRCEENVIQYIIRDIEKEI